MMTRATYVSIQYPPASPVLQSKHCHCTTDQNCKKGQPITLNQPSKSGQSWQLIAPALMMTPEATRLLTIKQRLSMASCPLCLAGHQGYFGISLQEASEQRCGW